MQYAVAVGLEGNEVEAASNDRRAYEMFCVNTAEAEFSA